jgi:hypothetical protein
MEILTGFLNKPEIKLSFPERKIGKNTYFIVFILGARGSVVG